MALTPLPTAADLSTFSHGQTDVFEIPEQQLAIDQASVLLWLATTIENYTGDATIDKIIRWGVLDMAWSLLIKTENKTAYYSDFNSERIGSYSYSKATKQVQAGIATDVQWFDAAVTLLLGETGAGAVWSVSEQVFAQPYEEPTDSSDFVMPQPTFGFNDTPTYVDGGGP